MSVVFIVLILGSIIGGNQLAILTHWKEITLALALVPCALSAIASCLIGSLAAAFWRGAPESTPSEAALT